MTQGFSYLASQLKRTPEVPTGVVRFERLLGRARLEMNGDLRHDPQLWAEATCEGHFSIEHLQNIGVQFDRTLTAWIEHSEQRRPRMQ